MRNGTGTPPTRILSWNVNGLRAVLKKGFTGVLAEYAPDIVCLQETKLQAGTVPVEIAALQGYHAYYSFAERKGYSGVALLTRSAPAAVEHGFGIERFDSEGRILIARYEDFDLFCIYFPNGKMSRERLAYKMAFYDACLENAMERVKKGRHVIICGDVNTAHMERDLARPKQNEKVSGFLPEERAWIDRLIAAGFVDTFRLFSGAGGQYTWWDLKTRARERNVGWRIDYFFVDAGFAPRVRASTILADIGGSDHCPILLEIDGAPEGSA
ncbi:MAG: exodeoxyribonuclease III [Methanomicrobiales archaeon]|nr:exodeoxyribonuclease III [Methanomicrobiales archaeon]